jgi:hypothetical protein
MSRRILLNRSLLDNEAIGLLDRVTNSTVADGAYWYDRRSGAWGDEGGPCRAFLRPGLGIGGSLPRDASNGTTGVIVNGRELHLLEVAALQRIGPVYRGHFWIDGEGNWGVEGGPAQGNLARAVEQITGGNASQRPPTIDDRVTAEV